ncbi:hypothetical protein Bhyg_06257 [Pseudolycoriella hygida]|uniref:Uncharacterized protein n=1 Tax=Pseudolycoriella hygida TaxID=35572 RepID=A0A9Q0N1A5_9DIPT|nr:hypothetical protein Bhyg_06257 [Pseudolycoriella hygida]
MLLSISYFTITSNQRTYSVQSNSIITIPIRCRCQREVACNKIVIQENFTSIPDKPGYQSPYSGMENGMFSPTTLRVRKLLKDSKIISSCNESVFNVGCWSLTPDFNSLYVVIENQAEARICAPPKMYPPAVQFVFINVTRFGGLCSFNLILSSLEVSFLAEMSNLSPMTSEFQDPMMLQAAPVISSSSKTFSKTAVALSELRNREHSPSFVLLDIFCGVVVVVATDAVTVCTGGVFVTGNTFELFPMAMLEGSAKFKKFPNAIAPSDRGRGFATTSGYES